MKKTIKKSLATLLALLMISSAFVCLAAVEINKEAVDAHYDQYKNYVLLGDSVASGYRDVMRDRDQQYNTENKESAFYRIEGSYADIIADSIIADGSMTPMAGPGFRTIEIRYMLEDDYAATCEDEYLFYCSNVHSNGDPITKWRPLYQEAVRNADLITLGVGGNDWGAYITWVIAETLIKAGVYDELLSKVQALLAKESINLETIGKVINEISENKDALAEVVSKLPEALEYGLTTFYENWDIMIEDIYTYNPDVTLMVVGMSDNGVKGKYYDYDGVEGGPVTEGLIGGSGSDVSKYIIDFIMTVGNTPMIEGAKKFGYTYVDTTGTTYVESHPDADGHIHIANKIIEALPNKEYYNKFEDVTPGHKYYSAVEYVVSNGIMAPKAENYFCVEENISEGELAAALGKDIVNSNRDITVVGFAFAIIGAGATKGFIGFFKGLGLACKIMAQSNFNISGSITRGLAADYLRTFNEF